MAQEKSQQLANTLEKYLERLVERMDAYLDTRLVRTFVQGMRAIIEVRNQAPGLVLSELGAYVRSRLTSHRRSKTATYSAGI